MSSSNQIWKTMTDGSYYQKNTKIEFVVGSQTQANIIKKLSEEMDETYKRYMTSGITGLTTKSCNSPKISRRQFETLLRTGTSPICGQDNEEVKTQKMLGIFHIFYSNGQNDKILTISGNNRFSKDQTYIRDGVNFLPGITRPLQFKNMGYTLINIEEPKGKVTDLTDGKDTDVEFSRSCAAQKAMKYIGDKIKTTKGMTVKKIEMREQIWIAPDQRNNTGYSRFDSAVSCNYCDVVLGAAAGNKSGN